MRNKITLCSLLIGVFFYSSTAQNAKGLKSVGISEITIIEIANNGDIWVGTMGDGAFHYSATGQLQTHFTRANFASLRSDTINDIVTGAIDTVPHAFLGTPSGLSYTKGSSAFAINSLPPNNENVSAVVLNGGDSLISFSATAGGVEFDTNQSFIGPVSLPFSQISCVQGTASYTCTTGMTIGSVDSGAAYTTDYINYTTLTVPTIVSDSVTAVYLDRNCGARFIGTRHGFSFCPVGHPSASYTTTNSSLPDNYITAIAQDCKGNVWLGTRSAGIAVFNPQTQAFSIINTSNGLTTDSITALAFETDSCVNSAFVGGADGNVLVVDSNHAVIQIVNSIQSPDDNLPVVHVFPQPANTEVNFLFETPVTGAQFSFTDINGRTLGTCNLNNASKLTLDVTDIASGLYLYKVYNGAAILKTGKFEVLK